MHFRTVVILLLISVLVCTGVFLFAKHRIAKAHEEGYQQALDDAGIDPVTMELDENATVEAGSLLEAVQSAKDLIAYKYHYESVGDYQKEKTFFGTDLKVPFTQDRSIFVYRGTISAGIDLKDLSASVDNSKKEITVFLPQPAVLAHEFEIDSFRIYDLKDSIFTKTSLADYAGLFLTVLVIAHRMRTVEAADRIVVLVNGRVAEEGSPSALLAREDSIFHRMAQLQSTSAGWSV